MRGDSLRDLYAKLLAVLGLALLGGVGAAVDYWPTDLAMPVVAAFDRGVALPGRLSARAMASEPVAFARARASIVVRGEAPAPASIVPASFEGVSQGLPALDLTPAPPAEMPALVPEAFSGIEGHAAAEVELSAPVLTPIFTSTTIAPAQQAANHQSLLGGIGSGIVDGTAKAGSAVVDGLKTVGGAIGGAMNSLRKHFPFFQSASRVSLSAPSTRLQ